MVNNVITPAGSIFDRQTKYALRMYKCQTTKSVDASGNEYQVDNLMEFQVDRPFVLLHAFVVKETSDRDRYSDLSQGVSNALLYLDNHPVVQIMAIAEISAFHIAAGRFYVQDLRPVDGDTDENGNVLKRNDFDQFVFVLLCLNF
jgi:hypothetical protein